MVGSLLLKSTLIQLRKNGERLPHSSMHNSSQNSATIIRKFRDQGSKFSNETQRFACVLCYYFGSSILNVPLSIYGKTEKDFLIVACVKAADNSATFTRKNQDQGLIFRHETRIFLRGCCRPLLL